MLPEQWRCEEEECPRWIRFRSRSYILLARTDGRFRHTSKSLVCLLTICACFRARNAYKKQGTCKRVCLGNIKLHVMANHPLTNTILGLSIYTCSFGALSHNVLFNLDPKWTCCFGELFICHMQTSSWGQVTSVNTEGGL